MDSELNEEEEDTLLLKAYTGHFDHLHYVDEPVINIDFSEDAPSSEQSKEEKTVKINKKLQYIPESVKEYFAKIESVREILKKNSGDDSGREKDSGFRYFSLICHKCGLSGHFSVECPNKNFASCYLCGEQHLSRECPNQLCFRCFTPGHLRRDCRLPQASKIPCIRCYRTGHIPTDCPTFFNFEDREIYCYNCGYEGHSGITCSEFTADILFDALKKNTTPVQNSRASSSKTKNSPNIRNGSNKKKRKSVSSPLNGKKKASKKKKRKSY